MKPIKKHKILDKDEYYQTHLSIVNCMLPIKMTNMETKVLASFMCFSGDFAKDRFGPSARKIVKKELGLSSAGMSNYIRTLKEKGFLLEREDKELEILSILFPQDKEQLYIFKLTNQSNDS